MIKIGDKVKVISLENSFAENVIDDYKHLLGQVGTVSSIYTYDVRVNFDNGEWWFIKHDDYVKFEKKEVSKLEKLCINSEAVFTLRVSAVTLDTHDRIKGTLDIDNEGNFYIIEESGDNLCYPIDIYTLRVLKKKV